MADQKRFWQGSSKLWRFVDRSTDDHSLLDPRRVGSVLGESTLLEMYSNVKDPDV